LELNPAIRYNLLYLLPLAKANGNKYKRISTSIWAIGFGISWELFLEFAFLQIVFKIAFIIYFKINGRNF
jgi:hypothetical protein